MLMVPRRYDISRRSPPIEVGSRRRVTVARRSPDRVEGHFLPRAVLFASSEFRVLALILW